MTKNKESTRYASSTQESRIAKKLGGYVNSNSGAGKFAKSDVVVKSASLSIECKTCMSPKESFSIRKDWITKHHNEALSNHLYNSVIAFNFDFEDSKDYYVIDDKLMTYLVSCLSSETS